jgi:hypothetical protein
MALFIFLLRNLSTNFRELVCVNNEKHLGNYTDYPTKNSEFSDDLDYVVRYV